MDERLSYLVTRLRKRFSSERDVAEVEAYLSSEGFDGGQIGTIVSAWLSDIVRGKRGKPVASSTWPVRVQGPHEMGRFAPEAWGHLLTLRASGALSAAELEQVIERALMHAEGRVSLEDLRSLLDAGGWDAPGAFGEPSTVH